LRFYSVGLNSSALHPIMLNLLVEPWDLQSNFMGIMGGPEVIPVTFDRDSTHIESNSQIPTRVVA
jgi:hypothetical protein